MFKIYWIMHFVHSEDHYRKFGLSLVPAGHCFWAPGPGHQEPSLTGPIPLPPVEVSSAGHLHFPVPGCGHVTWAPPATELHLILWTRNWWHQTRHGSWWLCWKLGDPLPLTPVLLSDLGGLHSLQSPFPRPSWKSVIFPFYYEFKSGCLRLQRGALLDASPKTASLQVLFGNLTCQISPGRVLTISAAWWAHNGWIQKPCGWVLGICILNKPQAGITFRYSKV